jgi:hypothetical protein
MTAAERAFLRKHTIIFGLVLGAATSAPAFAQGTPTGYPECTKAVSNDDTNAAHQKYIAGKQDYDEGNYESAIRRFRDAYALDCTKHELLVILSAAYERKGDKKEAAAALEAFVARVPNAPDVSTYQAKIENLKRQMAASSQQQAGPVKTETQEHTIYPWIVTGVGAVAIIVGIAVYAAAPAIPTTCDSALIGSHRTCSPLPGEEPNSQTLKDREVSAGNAAGEHLGGVITIGAGVAMVAGGLVWHFLEPTGPKEAAPRPVTTKLRPLVTPSFAGLSLGGSF